MKEKEKIYLRGTNSEFVKCNRSKRYEIYRDSVRNNVLVFQPCHESCDTESICNGIMSDMYLKLMNIINTNNNVVVRWSQIEGTTSDYTVYMDVNLSDSEVRSYDKVINILREQTKEWNGFKYNMVKEGKMIPIRRDGY